MPPLAHVGEYFAKTVHTSVDEAFMAIPARIGTSAAGKLICLAEKKILQYQTPPLTKDRLRTIFEQEGGVPSFLQRKERIAKRQATVNDKARQWESRKRSRDEDTCVVCMDAEKTHSFVPCGHKCVCKTCGETLRNKCPICKQKVQSILRVYD